MKGSKQYGLLGLLLFYNFLIDLMERAFGPDIAPERPLMKTVLNSHTGEGGGGKWRKLHLQ